MRRPSRNAVRLLLALVVLASAGSLAASYVQADTVGSKAVQSDRPRASTGPGSPSENTTNETTDGTHSAEANATRTNGTAAPRTIEMRSRLNRSNVTTTGRPVGNLTVVATQGFFVTDEQAELVAFDESGDLVYYDDAYRVYFDVDPVPDARYTVQYVAAKHFGGDDCAAFETDRCTRNVVERVNLTTGNVTRIYAKVTPGIGSTRWHDADRLDEDHLVAADVYRDGIFVVNTSAGGPAATGVPEDGSLDAEGTGGVITTRWNASQIYSRDIGGKEGDWTHINDVEVLDDGRIMVSVRNMDQVIFLEPCDYGTAGEHDPSDDCAGYVANESWTLGTDENYEILFEQHNPDYIPPERGGPAVIVADSENNRIVEYQRVDGDWARTWTWKDVRLQWPRDADRLPNDNTLVTDTHGDRVAEVTPGGRVVWSVHIGMPYDAERLGTGDESAGGRSMAAIRDARRDENASAGGAGLVAPGAGTSTRGSPTPVGAVLLWLKSVVPSYLINSALYVAPGWVQFAELVVATGAAVTLVGWTGLEWYWSRFSVRRGLGRLRGRLRRGE
ncbi:MAG: aryl-sulfate sulfotransferase [Haloferacaceae archaeon]